MGKFVSHKLIERTESEDNHIVDTENNRACDFDVENTGVFLNIKCYSSHETKKYRNVRICLTDILFQVWKQLTFEQKKALKLQIENVISK